MKAGKEKIRMLLVDDHAVVRAGLRLLINAQPDMEVVGEAADGTEAIEQTVALSPDVVLLDLSMPGLSGLSALGIIRQKAPQTRILVLTMHDEEGYLRQVLAAGGSGYVAKKAADVELLSAIRAVNRGEVYVYSSLTRALVKGELGGRQQGATETPDQFERLSERKKTILHLLVLGYTNKQIAEQILLSVKTVETYRARLMEDLNLRTRAELVRFAVKKGLLTLQ